MGKINIINNKSGSLTIDPSAASDSYVQLASNGTPQYIEGIDQSASSYKISAGSSLGTNDYFVMTTAGERSLPVQSCFMAFTGGGTGGNGFIPDVTGDGTVFTLPGAIEIFDQNNDYSDPTFTAPIAGKYRFCGATFFGQVLDSTNSVTRSQILTTNVVFTGGVLNPIIVGSPTGGVPFRGTMLFTALTEMDAGDTAVVTVQVIGLVMNVGTGTSPITTPKAWLAGYLAF